MKLVVTLLVAAFAAASVWLFVLVPSAHPRHADAIVVLSPGEARVVEGEKLYAQGVAPKLFVSRPVTTPSCPAHATCFHARPYSTLGEAKTVAHLAREHGWKRVVIVTSRYHLRRAKMLFGRCLGYEPPTVAAPTSVFAYVRNIPLEWAKFAYELTIDRGC